MEKINKIEYSKQPNTKIIISLIPVVLISLMFLYPKETAYIAATPLGKLIVIILIFYYTRIDIIYGLLLCIVFIVYFHYNYTEGFLNQFGVSGCSCNMCKKRLEGFSNETNSDNSRIIKIDNEFRKQYCKNGTLIYKNSPVNLEMAQHVFPELSFSNGICNPCSDTCMFSIIEEQLKTNEQLKPKTSDDFSLNTILEKIGDFVPALWVKSEPFATFE